MRDTYSNTKSSGFTVNFFSQAAVKAKAALIAVPFFTDYEPLAQLTSNGCDVSLIIRLCEATSPEALKKALQDPNISVRYYTARSFHPKLYIIDDMALVGSANLTKSGMQSNREVSVVLRRERDSAFGDLPGIFDELWTFADVLNPKILDAFAKVRKSKSSLRFQRQFEEALKDAIKPVAPKSIVAGSDLVSKERAFLQSFRRKYDEVLIPYHKEIMFVAREAGFGRQEYAGQDPQIEMGRFLGWVRLVHGPKDEWRNVPLLEPKEREFRIRQYVNEWQSTSDTVARDMYDAEKEIQNIGLIRSAFINIESIDSLDYDSIFDALIGCHAFLEQLRFTKGGLPNLRKDFAKRNSLPSIKKTLSYLLHGPGDSIQRAYDCLHDDRYRLERFGEASVMELLGWHSRDRPPFNNRTIRGMRFLGFDVEHYVAG